MKRAMGPSIIDPYVPFIVEALEQYPMLTAARLYAMALDRGFTGGASHFRARVAQPVFHLIEGQTGPQRSRIPTSVAIVVQEQAGKIISVQDYHRR